MGGLNGAEAADKDAFTFSLDAMQLTPQSQTTLYDLSDDVLRMILLFLSNVDDIGWGQGGMNILRLVSKRLMCVVESCTTTLSNR